MSTAPRHLHVAGQFASAYEGVDDGSQYDYQGFYVRSVNKHDHRAETRVQMQPEVYARINDLIASGQLAGTPVKSYQSFMRDAAVHNFERIGRLLNLPDLLEFAAQERQLALIEQETDRADMYRKVIEDADGRLNAATKANDVWLVDYLLTMYGQMTVTMRAPFAADLEDVLTEGRRWLKAKNAG